MLDTLSHTKFNIKYYPHYFQHSFFYKSDKVVTLLFSLFERSEFLIATCKKKKTDLLSVRMFG